MPCLSFKFSPKTQQTFFSHLEKISQNLERKIKQTTERIKYKKWGKSFNRFPNPSSNSSQDFAVYLPYIQLCCFIGSGYFGINLLFPPTTYS